MNTAVLGSSAGYDEDEPRSATLAPASAAGKKFVWQVIFVILALGTLVAFILYSQMGTSMERIGQLEASNAFLERTNSELNRKVASLPALKKELADTKRSLTAEVKRKSELATLYERAEAGRKQAMADHAAALDRIAALEKAKGIAAKKAAPPKRK